MKWGAKTSRSNHMIVSVIVWGPLRLALQCLHCHPEIPCNVLWSRNHNIETLGLTRLEKFGNRCPNRTSDIQHNFSSITISLYLKKSQGESIWNQYQNTDSLRLSLVLKHKTLSLGQVESGNQDSESYIRHAMHNLRARHRLVTVS